MTNEDSVFWQDLEHDLEHPLFNLWYRLYSYKIRACDMIRNWRIWL